MSVLTAQILLARPWGLRLFAGWYNDKMYPIKPADYAEQTARMRAMLAEPNRLRALRIMFSDSGADLDNRLATLSQPTLLIMGGKDPDFPNPAKEAQEYPKRMRATKPTVLVIPGAGHHPQAQMPKAVGDAILSLLEA